MKPAIPLILLALVLAPPVSADEVTTDPLQAGWSLRCARDPSMPHDCTSECPMERVWVEWMDPGFYEEPFVVRVAPDPYPGPRRSYSGLALFTGSTALANALVVAGNTRSDALAAGGFTFGLLSLVASLSERTVARPMHFVLGVTSIVLSVMNLSNSPDTSGPGAVQSAAEYKGSPVGFSISF